MTQENTLDPRDITIEVVEELSGSRKCADCEKRRRTVIAEERHGDLTTYRTQLCRECLTTRQAAVQVLVEAKEAQDSYDSGDGAEGQPEPQDQPEPTVEDTDTTPQEPDSEAQDEHGARKSRDEGTAFVADYPPCQEQEQEPEPEPEPQPEPEPVGQAQPASRSNRASIAGKVFNVKHGAIEPDPEQPRKTFGPNELQELAESMDSQGLLQPIILRPHPQAQGRKKRYMLIAGERRWRAAGILKWETIPAIVRDDLDPRDAAKVQLLENIVRVDLDPVEEARAMKRLLDEGYTWQELAAAIGKPTMHVYCNTTMLEACEEALHMVSAGNIAPRACYEISQLTYNDQKRVLTAIGKGNLTYPDILALCQRFKEKPEEPALMLQVQVPSEQALKAKRDLTKTLDGMMATLNDLFDLEEKVEGTVGSSLDAAGMVKLDQTILALQKAKRMARQYEVAMMVSG